MADRKTVMSWLEGLAQDDWREWHSDSEVQTTAQAALDLLKEYEPKPVIKDMYGNAYCPHCSTASIVEMGLCKLRIGARFCQYCGKVVKWDE